MDASSSLQGHEVGRDEAPALWATLDELAARLRMQPVDRIVVISGPGAAAMEHPERRRPWRRQRTMAVGLPLLAGLTVAQMQAVMAHEMAHFSHHFGWFGYWCSWAAQAGRRWLGSSAASTWFSRRSAHGFGPWLGQAAGAAAARAEFEADAWAAKVTSAGALGEALLRLAVASAKPAPVFGDGPLPESPWHDAAPGLGAAVSIGELADALRLDSERHARQASSRGAHPSAQDRIDALHWPVPAELPAIPADEAAGPRWWGEAGWAARLRFERHRWRAENARAWHTEACWREACSAELARVDADDLDTVWECAHALGMTLPLPPDDGLTPDAAPPLHAYWRGVAWQASDAAEATWWLQAAARHSAGLEAPSCLRLLEPMPGRAPRSAQVRESLADARERRNHAKARAAEAGWAEAHPVQAAAWRTDALRQALASDPAVLEAFWLQQTIDAPGARRYPIVTLCLSLSGEASHDEAACATAYSPLLARVITPAAVGQVECVGQDAAWPAPLARLLARQPELRLK